MELERMFRGDKRFTLLDLGSCCGFFSLQAAAGFAEAQVLDDWFCSSTETLTC